MKNAIITHKNCMDGVASASIMLKLYPEADVYFCTYYKEQEVIEQIQESPKYDKIIFADFSFNKDRTLSMLDCCNTIEIYDHHKTAEAELSNDEIVSNPRISVVFDGTKSGATICRDYIKQYVKITEEASLLYDYIQDRDIWTWKLDYSKEINEALRFYIRPNNIESFNSITETLSIEDLCHTGNILFEKQRQYVKSKVSKVSYVQFEGETYGMVNSTEYISELGNAISEELNVPALLFFVDEEGSVICSLRSKDSLIDVSLVAKKYGGGGHRNAAGFKTDFGFIQELYGRKN